MHMYKIETYCLKCKKNTKNIDLKNSSTSEGKAMYYQSVPYVAVRNPNLLKIKKEKDY